MCFRIVFEEGRPLKEAIGLAEAQLGRVPEVREFIEFIRGTTIGINHIRNDERRNWCA